MKGKDAERGDDLKVKSWAYSEEVYDCHLYFRWGAIRYHSYSKCTGYYVGASCVVFCCIGCLCNKNIDVYSHREDACFIFHNMKRNEMRNPFIIILKALKGRMEDYMSIFTGSGTAIVTPMNADGSVNYESFRKLIEFQIENQTDAIIVCGTTGEASTLTHEEHLDVIKYCVDVVNKRIPVIAGTGSNCTQTAIYLSTEAEKLGADGLLLVSPYYNKATQNGLFAHFKAVADAVKIPIILYNVQSRTGMNITPATIVRLFDACENIVAVKEASGNISQVAKIAALSNGKIDIYSGNDDQVLPILSLGGKGVISVLSNVAPRQTHEMCAKYFEGDTAGATQMQLKAIELIEALFCEVNPIPVKQALNLMGMEAGILRLPLTEMEAETTAKLKAAMEEYGIL